MCVCYVSNLDGAQSRLYPTSITLFVMVACATGNLIFEDMCVCICVYFVCMCVHNYGTAQFKLDIYMHVTCEFLVPLTIYMQANH